MSQSNQPFINSDLRSGSFLEIAASKLVEKFLVWFTEKWKQPRALIKIRQYTPDNAEFIYTKVFRSLDKSKLRPRAQSRKKMAHRSIVWRRDTYAPCDTLYDFKYQNGLSVPVLGQGHLGKIHRPKEIGRFRHKSAFTNEFSLAIFSLARFGRERHHSPRQYRVFWDGCQSRSTLVHYIRIRGAEADSWVSLY